MKKAKGATRLRKIDLVSWRSAVAKQHGIRGLPSVWVYEGMSLATKDTRAAFRLLASGAQ